MKDEECIFTQQAGVEDQTEIEFVGHSSYVPQVLNGEGLSPDEVRGCFHTNERDVLGAMYLDDLFQLLNVHVPFEGVR